MNLTEARNRAAAWSTGTDKVAVVKARPGEVNHGYYTERFGEACPVPPEQIVAIYEHGQPVERALAEESAQPPAQ